MLKSLLIVCSLSFAMLGCAGWSSAPKVATSCTFDRAWSVALASVDEFELRHIDKADGIIETEWILFASKQTAGIFQRDQNKERVKFFLTLSRKPEGTQIEALQMREFFSPMGVQSQSRWRRIPPNKEEEQRLANRISNQLRAKGCAILI